MATTAPLSAKSKLAGPGASLKITPSNSPVLRPGTRSPSKSSHQSFLSLQTVLGTTTTAPNGFSSHDQSRSFALCAGSAAVLAELDEDANLSQRFFRARPSATGVNPTSSFYNQATPPATPDPRSRSLSHIRSNQHLNIPNASPSSETADNGSPRAWSSRERVKAVTSVAISPNGRLLAVGETGYNPRVLIFSTARDAPPDIPLSILSEHTFGVRSLAFSPDSQYLATLGNMNDGFLFIWAINLKNGSAKLHSANKCTSFVRDMCWVGQSLVTTGVRHVKVWRLPAVRPVSPTKSRLNVDGAAPSPNPAPKALSGRNCLLGTLGDSTFSCVGSISDQEAVVGTESGTVCLLDDREGSQKLSRATHVGFGITSLTVDFDREAIWLGGRGRKMQRLSFDSLRCSSLPSPMSPARLEKSVIDKRDRSPAIICMGALSSHLITVEATREIRIFPMDALREEGEQEHSETSIPAHRDPVLGIGRLQVPNNFSATFFSWSRNGSVHFWGPRGKCMRSTAVFLDQNPGIDDDIVNELKVLRVADDAQRFVSGDKFGVLRLFSSEPWTCTHDARAHGGEITDIAIHSSPESYLVASSGRDRMVQLFQQSETGLQLVQTMDDHVGAVGQVLFTNDGEKLLSSSADRTVLVRERATREIGGATSVAYLISKVITLKASPISMAFCPDDSSILFLSTMDRCVSKFDIPSGRQLHCFKSSDSEANDAVIMGSLTVTSEIPDQNPKLLIGLSSTDKSIRVYDLDRDQLLIGEFGHTEGVSDVLLLEECDESDKSLIKRSLISAGIDGLLMIWDLSIQPLPDHVQNGRDEEGPSKEMTAAKPPLRKVLSRSELAGFQRPDNPLGTPTPARELSPTLTRKMSKLSLTPSTLKNQSFAETPSPPNRLSPINYTPIDQCRRSPSPVSPKSKPSAPRNPSSAKNSTRRTSLDFRSRAKATSRSEFGSLDMSTEQVCRTLRAYRKKLNGSTQHLQAQKELERELSLTLRAVSARSQASDESAETETDSSGKDMDRRRSHSSVSSRSPHQPRHMPSTPLLRHKGVRQVSRSRSYDAAGGE
ncbi:uncharacterized protein N7459_008853 [Penicillium hispanicum]|uniref:uncharacterized protein n=1 Tax=Penicillium hispanicum TaxID=1080232 RepID=UPI0025409EBF|nr:uncharacterized protein N7459_008853 [Penicillium hispanicum]KAJ5569423.1 hypothetical protein N7459_008853 [Penicillium hispanicum]